MIKINEILKELVKLLKFLFVHILTTYSPLNWEVYKKWMCFYTRRVPKIQLRCDNQLGL